MDKKTFIALGLLAIALITYNLEKTMGAIPNEAAFFEDSLASKVTSTQSTMTLVKGTTKTGNLASSTYGFVIDEGSSVEEVVICDCTATACTNCKRGISDVDGQTETTALKFEHRRGAVVKMTDHPSLIRSIRVLNGTDAMTSLLYYSSTSVSASPSSTALIDKNYLDTQIGSYLPLAGGQIAGNLTFDTASRTIATIQNGNLLDKSDTETITGTFTFNTLPQSSVVCSSANQLCNKSYIDSVAIAGAPSSSETVYGISKLSVAPASVNFPTAVGTNDTRMVNYATDSGSTDDYVISTGLSISASTTGATFIFKANTANTGAATLRVDSLATTTIKKNHDQDLETGDIESGQWVVVTYDGTYYQMNSPTAVRKYNDDWILVSKTTASASSSVLISGLDLNTDKMYKIYLDSFSEGSTSTNIYMKYNQGVGCTTGANYFEESGRIQASSVASTDYYSISVTRCYSMINPTSTGAYANESLQRMSSEITIRGDSSSTAPLSKVETIGEDGAPDLYNYTGMTRLGGSNYTNVTSTTFYCSDSSCRNTWTIRVYKPRT